ncbi:hypothetical protein C8J56DRAFT_21958 [Mycena floridula]|nr:hypothetical protein C8J56DRAFT_21958 [Mycena floridula]
MGKSAKLHKRTKKLKSSTSSSVAIASTTTSHPVQAAKKKRTLKTGSRKAGDGPVLGGADYVSLMMGSRKRAREEALKLPVDSTT